MRDWMVLAASALLLMPSVKSFADEPLLRFGVVSDIHVTAADDGTLKRSDNLDHWGNEGKPAAVEAIDRAGKTGKVFFHVQHPHVKGTVYGGNVWGQDNGASFAALSKYPQAVSFSGHSHTPLENEQSIWQGAFTAVGTASLRYISISSYRSTQFPRGYENGKAAKGAKGDAGAKVMASEVYHTDLHQGLFVRVYSDRIVFSRREFGAGVPGPNDMIYVK